MCKLQLETAVLNRSQLLDCGPLGDFSDSFVLFAVHLVLSTLKFSLARSVLEALPSRVCPVLSEVRGPRLTGP